MNCDIFELDRDYFTVHDSGYWWFNIHFDQLPKIVRDLNNAGEESFDIDFDSSYKGGDYRVQYHPNDSEMLELYDNSDRLVAVTHVDLLDPCQHDWLKEEGELFLSMRILIE
jgi:hypothetical protein